MEIWRASKFESCEIPLSYPMLHGLNHFVTVLCSFSDFAFMFAELGVEPRAHASKASSDTEPHPQPFLFKEKNL